MKICSPVGYPLPPSLGGVDRPRALEGLRIGLLDNTKAPVDKIMLHLDSRLRERISGVQVLSVSKRHSSWPAGAEIMKTLRQNCDVLINGLGD